MELNGKLADAFNDQITLELQAATAYRQLAIDMDVLSLPGIAGWFRAQAAEELEHAEKFTTHMLDRGAHPRIGAMEAPGLVAETVQGAFEAALAHEKKVSEAIRDLYRLSRNEDDVDSVPLLNWFVEEQVEEESTVGGILDRVKMINNDGNGLLSLDAELAAR